MLLLTALTVWFGTSSFSSLNFLHSLLHWLTDSGDKSRQSTSLRLVILFTAFVSVLFLEIYESLIQLIDSPLTDLLLLSLLVPLAADEFASLEAMTDAIGRDRVTLMFSSNGSSFYRDILTHQSDTMILLHQTIEHNPVAFANLTELLLAVSNGWGE